MESQKVDKSIDSIEASVTIPIPKLFEIELRFQRKKLVVCENIKGGEAKVFCSNSGWLIVFYDNKSNKLRYAFVDKKGKLSELGELGED